MIKFGRFEVSTVVHDSFALDGGAMFGSVPKTLWSRRIAPDDSNRIPLVTRSLLVKTEDKQILVDVGCGDKWDAKSRDIYSIDNLRTDPSQRVFDNITDIVLTHLHFDHAAGISRFNNGELELSFPNATIHLQKDNLETARTPSLRERASYLQDHVGLLSEADLNIINGTAELFPDFFVHKLNGHTRGLQWVELKDGSDSIVFPSDLIPTAHHLPLPYIMGYDICAETTLSEKESFLQKAVSKNWLVVFQHDRDTVAGRIDVNERGHFALKESLEF